ncbi:Hypothetical predicted protein [Marmota monax]|uniref:Uncharacterized protein n=1 Tax=Marmota monax TaxID=9995 RepID=A0A5E4CUB2_MARMO|nr:hypothetical protein GHT09_003842 [Marmota monax]VTJ85394.1 Hypothetical predicted protein [Marmota monax]
MMLPGLEVSYLGTASAASKAISMVNATDEQRSPVQSAATYTASIPRSPGGLLLGCQCPCSSTTSAPDASDTDTTADLQKSPGDAAPQTAVAAAALICCLLSTTPDTIAATTA